jgi:3-demethoxyubiquinol 3-hydroxylase
VAAQLLANNAIQHTDLGNRILKVNHAGEHGAVNIYAGQIFFARLTARNVLAELREFRLHEERHRAIFWAELERRGKPRCKSYVLCGLGGFALGLITGMLGKQAIAATTVAVERVVLAHLNDQVHALRGQDDDAVVAINSILRDERDHHDRSSENLQTKSIWTKLLQPVVAASTETVIWLGMRL